MIILDGNGDIMVFENIYYATRYLEPIDAEKETLRCFDGLGNMFYIRVNNAGRLERVKPDIENDLMALIKLLHGYAKYADSTFEPTDYNSLEKVLQYCTKFIIQ